MARVYPGPREVRPTQDDLDNVEGGWTDFMGVVRKVADGAELLDRLQVMMTNPQGKVAVCLKMGAKVARSSGMNKGTFLALCGMAYDDGPPP
jgi:hypothetical protein